MFNSKNSQKMKTSFVKRARRAALVVALTGMLASNATAAAPSVRITVNPKPTLTVGTDTLSQCPNKSIVYYNGASITPNYVFDIPTEAGIAVSKTGTAGTLVTEYSKYRDFRDTLTTAAVRAYKIDAASTETWDSIFVRAYQFASCFSNFVGKVELNVHAFPALGITSSGGFTACSRDSFVLAPNGTIPSGTTYAWSLKTGAVGTLANATSASPGIKFNDNTTASAITDTLSLTYTTGGCSYTVQQELILSLRPNTSTTALTSCYMANVDLTGQVSVTNGVSPTYTYYSDRAMQTVITDSNSYAVAATGVDTMIYVKAAIGSCTSVDSFRLTVYPQIQVTLALATDSVSTTLANECAAVDGAATQGVALNIKITGGCPTASNYVVTLDATNVTVAGNADVSVAGTTLTIPTAKANSSVNFVVTVPVDGTDYTVDVNTVTQDGAAPSCNCSRSSW